MLIFLTDARHAEEMTNIAVTVVLFLIIPALYTGQVPGIPWIIQTLPRMQFSLFTAETRDQCARWLHNATVETLPLVMQRFYVYNEG